MKKDFNNNHNGTQGANMKESMVKIRKQWIWFVSCALLGAVAGAIYNEYSQNKYEVSSTLAAGGKLGTSAGYWSCTMRPNVVYVASNAFA